MEALANKMIQISGASRFLEAGLLHIGNKYPSVPVALVMYTKE
jgi:hypothetical protein